MPVTVPPAALSEELVAAFDKLTTSQTDQDIKPEPRIKPERPIKREIPVKREQSIKQKQPLKRETSREEHYTTNRQRSLPSEEKLVYHASSPPLITGWYFAHADDLDRARRLGPTQLPNGTTVSELRAEDVRVLREAGDEKLQGIGVVYFDSGWKGREWEEVELEKARRALRALKE